MNIENLTNTGMSKTVSNGRVHEINWTANYDGETLGIDLHINKNGDKENINFNLTKDQLSKSFHGIDIESILSNPEALIKQLTNKPSLTTATTTRKKKRKNKKH